MKRLKAGGSGGSARMDKYANIMNLAVTQSAANTLTFGSIELGFGQFERVGLIIARYEMYPEENAIGELDADADQLSMALTVDNTISDINADERAVIDTVRLTAHDVGTAGDSHMMLLPITRTFESLPGGGVIVSPRPLYFAVDSAGLAAARTVQFRLYFTVVKLRDADYFELLESRRFYG